jgi:hypothetical protein
MTLKVFSESSSTLRASPVADVPEVGSSGATGRDRL